MTFYGYPHDDEFYCECSQNKSTALHYASMNGHAAVVQLLLNARAKVDVVDAVSELHC